LSPIGKEKLPSALSKARILPSNVVPIGGDAKNMSFVHASKNINAGNVSPTASSPTARTSLVERGRKLVRLDAPASIGHQSFGQKATELFSWGSKRSK
uniref:Uncharacterized protein n=1 Tax=Romanomermis culicivorax TaxID=13658 RepID=A0A915KPX5_ROMCU